MQELANLRSEIDCAPGKLLPWTLAGLVALGEFALTIYLPALTAIARDLDVDIALIQDTISVGLLTFAVSGLAIGIVADSLGRRQLLLPSLWLYTIGSVLAASTTTVFWLFVGRVLQAFGACVGLIISRAIARDVRSGAELTRLLSIVALAYSLAPAIAPLLGGLLEEWFGWRAIFAFSTAYGGTMVLAIWWLPETNRAPTSRLKGAKVLAEYNAILMARSFLIPNLATAALFGALFAFIVSAAPIFVGKLHFSPALVGAFPTLAVLGLASGTFLASLMSTRVDDANIVRTGSLVALVAAVAMLFVPISAPYLLATITLFSMGFGVALPASTSLAMSEFGTRAGAASALLGFIQLIGATIGALLVPVAGSSPDQAMPRVMAIAGGIASVASWQLTKGRSRRNLNDRDAGAQS